MPLGFLPEHVALGESVAGFAARHTPRTQTRQDLGELAAGVLPGYWNALVEQGLHAVHLAESVGGTGAGAVEVAVILEEAGRALLPGPFLPTVLASTVLGRAMPAPAAEPGLRRLAAGATGACAVDAGGLVAVPADGGLEVTGTSGPVLGVPGADLVVLGAAGPDGTVWFWVDAERSEVDFEQVDGVDVTRAVGRVRVQGLKLAPDAVLATLSTETVQLLAAVLFSAEAAGVARWCVDTAIDYVKVREQFGRPVGSFQAVKHRCANLFVRVELATAAAWDAARAVGEADEQLSLAAAEAAVVCLSGAREMALDSLTLLGGIGYTWEHDIHFYWRRAVSLSQLLGPPGAWAERLGQSLRRANRQFRIEISADMSGFRENIAAGLRQAAGLAEPQRRHLLAERGLVSPEYPRPYGIEASPVEQLIISEEFAKAGIEQPSTVIGEFALPTIITHGSEVQKERFVPATLRGEIVWCQLFSEPNAGSDLASLQTKAVKVDGGWNLNGQKVWTSMADRADWAICLARTDPDVSKHRGISYFLVDMRSPGLDIRPLKQANGASEFCEEFITDLFVPDDCLVGDPGEGWILARTTLANERLMIAEGRGLASFGRLLALVAELRGGDGTEPDTTERIEGTLLHTLGELGAQSYALGALTLRSTLQRLEGLQPGAATSVLKVASTEHQRAVATAALELLGPQAATAEGVAAEVTRTYLSVPNVLLGGGTREIQLNVIAERILGLPRG